MIIILIFWFFVFSIKNSSHIFAHWNIGKSMVWNYVKRHETLWKRLTAKRKLQKRWSWSTPDNMKSAQNLLYSMKQFFCQHQQIFKIFFKNIDPILLRIQKLIDRYVRVKQIPIKHRQNTQQRSASWTIVDPTLLLWKWRYHWQNRCITT